MRKDYLLQYISDTPDALMHAIEDAYAREYLDNVVVEVSHDTHFPVFFATPRRVCQELAGGKDFFTEIGLVIIDAITVDSIYNSLDYLIDQQFFSNELPLEQTPGTWRGLRIKWPQYVQAFTDNDKAIDVANDSVNINLGAGVDPLPVSVSIDHNRYLMHVLGTKSIECQLTRMSVRGIPCLALPSLLILSSITHNIIISAVKSLVTDCYFSQIVSI